MHSEPNPPAAAARDCRALLEDEPTLVMTPEEREQHARKWAAVIDGFRIVAAVPTKQ